MKKTNIIIFVVIILVILAIFGYAIWDANKSLNEIGDENTDQIPVLNGEATQVNEVETNTQANETNQVNANQTKDQVSTEQNNTTNYVGDWYISEDAYRNAEEIDDILDRREDNLITDEEFERQMSSDINNSIPELDVDRYIQNQIRFDFKLTSPAPNQREAKIEDIVVDIDGNVGTFTYTDNWGTSGNGTITLKENQIELRLETTSAAQGAQWGVEGIYTFSYKRAD